MQHSLLLLPSLFLSVVDGGFSELPKEMLCISERPSTIGSLVNLEVLEIEGAIGHLSIFEHLTRLRKLVLNFCDIRGSLVHVQNLRRLVTLKLLFTFCRGSTENLEDLTLLEELDVRGVELDGDVNSLQNLGELRVLKISHTHVFGSLDFVQNMLNLETLYVTPDESGVHCELSALSKLTRLQDVDFTDFNGDHALSGNQSCLDGNLDLLSNLTNLQSLKISHGDVFGSVSSLSHLTNLKTLHMYDTLIDNPDEEEQALLAHLTDWSW